MFCIIDVMDLYNFIILHHWWNDNHNLIIFFSVFQQFYHQNVYCFTFQCQILLKMLMLTSRWWCLVMMSLDDSFNHDFLLPSWVLKEFHQCLTLLLFEYAQHRPPFLALKGAEYFEKLYFFVMISYVKCFQTEALDSRWKDYVWWWSCHVYCNLHK